jgi:hypothetical protein
MVMVYDAQEKVVYEQKIGQDGAWGELDAKYRITFGVDGIHVLRHWCLAGCANPEHVIMMPELRRL